MRRRAAPSLELRLAGRLAAIFVGAVALAFGGVYLHAVRTADSLRDQALQNQARDVARHLVAAPGSGTALELPAGLRDAYAAAGESFLFVVYDDRGRVRHASGPEAPALLEGHVPDGDGRFFEVAPGARGPLYGYVTSTRGLRVAVAQGPAHGDVLADSLIEEFVEVSAWWTIPVVAIALWVGTMTLRRSLAPLSELSERAARIGPHDADARLPEEGLPREVAPLVAAVNRALARLEAALEGQRRFTADAAHELRTPLAVLTARIDALEGVDIRDLRRDVDRINRIVEQLLRAARLDSARLDLGRRVDLRQVAVEAISAVAPLAVRQRRELVLGGEPDPVWVTGNPQAIGVAVTNLLENALAHTPAGSRIDVEVGADAAVRVLDRGPGVVAADREAIFRRFGRGRGARAPGSGLGLAIVLATVEAHGGQVEVADRPGGGAVFELRLRPYAPAASA